MRRTAVGDWQQRSIASATGCLVWAGHDKSTKHRRAEELMEEGHEIKIVGESEFMTLVSSKSGR